MTRLKRLTLILVVSVGSVVLLSACTDNAKAPPKTPTANTAATLAPDVTVQPGLATIISPKEGERMRVPITVSGTASVSEGTVVVIEIQSTDGNRTYCRAFTTASKGPDDTSTFEAMLAFPPAPSTPSLGATVHILTVNPEDGSKQELASVPFVITVEEPDVLINSPLCGASVKSPVAITGSASVSEGALTVSVNDLTGNELASADVKASEGTQGRGDFSQELSFSLSGGEQPGMIEAYSHSAADGSVINLFSVPVILTP